MSVLLCYTEMPPLCLILNSTPAWRVTQQRVYCVLSHHVSCPFYTDVNLTMWLLPLSASLQNSNGLSFCVRTFHTERWGKNNSTTILVWTAVKVAKEILFTNFTDFSIFFMNFLFETPDWALCVAKKMATQQ